MLDCRCVVTALTKGHAYISNLRLFCVIYLIWFDMLQEFTEDVAARSQAIARQFKSLKVCSFFLECSCECNTQFSNSYVNLGWV
jgi:hypothetical protein